MRALPTGTVTFLYTDIEGSTRLWQQYPQTMPRALNRHNELLQDAIDSHDGIVFRTMGDAYCAAFSRPQDALSAAEAAQRSLQSEPWPDQCRIAVRMAVHSGAAEVQDGDYVGHTLNRIARMLAAGHGGQILVSAATAELSTGQLPVSASLVDLGHHRLKDLAVPEHVFELASPGLRTEFPPLVTVDAHPTNLPLQPTTFVGREPEVSALGDMLRRPAIRLVTLTGPGGTGKTRLAIQTGAQVLDAFPDGVFFVALADVTDSAQVPSTIAQEIGLKLSPEQSPLDALIAHFHSRSLLLILDNFEQVLDASGALARMLATAPSLKVLVTSRIVLRLAGEQEHPVPPLSLPDPASLPSLDRLSQYDAVALFIDRARAIRAGFAVTNETAPAIAQICVRLDGLPLAIELAAARIRLFSPEALLTRLEHRLSLLTGGARDLPARQQTLRGAIDWSYDLLDPAEQHLFARLSVFAGGCSLEAAHRVCDPDGDLGIDVLDGISSLVEKSLLRADESDLGEPRFVMLETLREYAEEKLGEMEDASSVYEWHLQYFLGRSEEAFNGAMGQSGSPVRMDQLAADNDNLLAALDRAVQHGDVSRAMRLAAYLSQYWTSRGLWHDARLWTQRALALAPPDQFPRERGLLLWGAGMQDAVAGDVRAGVEQMLEGHGLLEAAGDEVNGIRALIFGGMFATTMGENERGVGLLNQGLAKGRAMDDPVTVGLAATALSHAALVAGEYDLARRYAGEAIEMAMNIEATYGLAHAENLLGDISRLEGAFSDAREHYQRALELTEQIGYRGFIPSFRHNLAWAAQDLGDAPSAIALFRLSIKEFQTMGDDRGVAECLVGLGCAAGWTEDAVRLFAAGFALLEKHGVTLSPPNERDYERVAAQVRAALGEDRWQTAWSEGARLTVDEAGGLLVQRPVGGEAHALTEKPAL